MWPSRVPRGPGVSSLLRILRPIGSRAQSCGSSARSAVPARAGSRRRAAAERGDPVGEAAQAGPVRDRRRRPVVDDLDHRPASSTQTRTVTSEARRAWRRSPGPRRRRSTPPPRRRRQPLRRQRHDLHRAGAGAPRALRSPARAAVGQEARVEAADELADLLERERQLGLRGLEQLRHLGRAAPRAACGSAAGGGRRVTSRCCAPSCRLRSMRRRSASPAATILARDSLSSRDRVVQVGHVADDRHDLVRGGRRDSPSNRAPRRDACGAGTRRSRARPDSSAAWTHASAARRSRVGGARRPSSR